MLFWEFSLGALALGLYVMLWLPVLMVSFVLGAGGGLMWNTERRDISVATGALNVAVVVMLDWPGRLWLLSVEMLALGIGLLVLASATRIDQLFHKNRRP